MTDAQDNWGVVVPRPAPLVRVDGLTDSARATALQLRTNIGGMRIYAQDFGNSVVLLNSASHMLTRAPQHLNVYMSWQMIAARHAVISLYNVQAIISGMKSERRRDPAYYVQSDNRAFVLACERFSKAFPHVRELRQTVMHSGDKASILERASKEKMTGPYEGDGFQIGFEGMGLGSALIQNVYISTHQSTAYQLEVSLETANELMAIYADFCSCITDLCE